MKKFCVLIAFFASGCANYYQICNSAKTDGWVIVEPTKEIIDIVGDSVSVETTGKLIWFSNTDGRFRICEAHVKQNCASGYRTMKKGTNREELVVSSCPSPY